MKLVIDKKLANNNYEVSVTIAEVLPEETELFTDFGSVSINVGGKLLDTDGITELATLGDTFKKIPTDFPLTKVFTQAQYGANAEKVANAYAKLVTDKVTSEITILKAKQDSFTGATEVIL